MKRRSIVLTSCGLAVLALLVAGVVIYRGIHAHLMVNKYFDLGNYRIINHHHAFATFARMSYTVFNLETPRVSPKSMLSEEKCAPWVSLIPRESVFYKPENASTENALTPDRERQKRLLSADIELKCYQLTRDLGKGFPDISVYYQQATGRATIEFPY